MKNQKGITLVALVITIIVLLILAGVSISLVVGQNGVLGKATNAVDSNELATAVQEIKLSIADCQMAYYDAWVTNQNTQRVAYYGNAAASTYAANCSSASSAPTVTNGTIAADGNSGEITITYVSKSQKRYTFVFDLSAPDKLYKGTSVSAGELV